MHAIFIKFIGIQHAKTFSIVTLSYSCAVTVRIQRSEEASKLALYVIDNVWIGNIRN
jgi:hypothetical protein